MSVPKNTSYQADDTDGENILGGMVFKATFNNISFIS